MGKSHSKNTFNQWDLDRFSNVTGIPRAEVERLYQEFISTTGKDNRMDKKEFRRLYKQLFLLGQANATSPVVLTDHDLDKISDRVFKAFDGDDSGKLTFEEFVNAYLLLSRSVPNTAVTSRDRLSYVLDHNNPTPGYVTREHGEEVFNNLNRIYGPEDATQTITTTTTPSGVVAPVITTTTTSEIVAPVTTTTTLSEVVAPVTTTTTPAVAIAPVTTNWEQHWTKLDDGTGRVPQEKFVEYITTSNHYKGHFDRF